MQKRLSSRRESLINVCQKRNLINDSADLSVVYMKNRFLKTALFFSNKHKVSLHRKILSGDRTRHGDRYTRAIIRIVVVGRCQLL